MTHVVGNHLALYVKVMVAGGVRSSRERGLTPRVLTLAEITWSLLNSKLKWRCVHR